MPRHRHLEAQTLMYTHTCIASHTNTDTQIYTHRHLDTDRCMHTHTDPDNHTDIKIPNTLGVLGTLTSPEHGCGGTVATS